DRSWLGDRADLTGHVVAQRGHHVAALTVLVRLLGGLPAQDDEGDHGLAGGVVLRAHHGRFGDPLVGDQGRFDLGGGQAVPGDVHDIVHPAQQPDVAVLVVLGAVTGEVGAGEAGPVGLLEPLLITPDAAQHTRPGFVDHQVATTTGAHRLTGVVPDLHLDTRQSPL